MSTRQKGAQGAFGLQKYLTLHVDPLNSAMHLNKYIDACNYSYYDDTQKSRDCG